MKKSLFVLLSCFSVVVLSSDIDLQTQYDCLRGEPTNKMIQDGVYCAVIKGYSQSKQILWEDPEHEAQLAVLCDDIENVAPDMKLGVSSFGSAILEVVGKVEESLKKQQGLADLCLAVPVALNAAKVMEEQRKLLLQEIARQPSFANHIRGLQFEIEKLSESE